MTRRALQAFWALVAFALLRLFVGLLLRHMAVSSQMLNLTCAIFVANAALGVYRRSRDPRA